MFEKGKNAYRKVLSHLNDRQRQLFRKRMRAKEWIDLDDFLDFNEAIVRVVYNGKMIGIEELGAESAEYGVKTFLKFFFQFGSVNFILNKATSAFSGYYRPGRVIIAEKGDHHSRMVVEQLPDRNDILMLRIKGFMGRMIELSGSTVKQVHTERLSDTNFEILAEWR